MYIRDVYTVIGPKIFFQWFLSFTSVYNSQEESMLAKKKKKRKKNKNNQTPICVKEKQFCDLFSAHQWWLGGKESTCNVGDAGSIPGSGRSLKKEMATHFSILAWRIWWTEEPGGLQSVGSPRVRHNWVIFTFPSILWFFYTVSSLVVLGFSEC